jgi:predicted dehydrogenase
VKTVPLRFGVIGLDNRSWLAARAHRPDEGVRVVAAGDPPPEPLARFQQQYRPDTFATRDYRHLLKREKRDAVFITSPDFCRQPQAVASLRATRRSIWKTDGHLCGGYPRRISAMGGLTVCGKIRDRSTHSDDGDASGNEANYPPLTLKGLSPRIDVEDLSALLMELEHGVFCCDLQCHYTPEAGRNYTLIGAQGHIQNFGAIPGNAVVKLWNKRRNRHCPQAEEEIVVPAENGSHGGADPRIVAEFVRFVGEGGVVETSSIAARYAVATGCTATQSLRQGSQPRNVPRWPSTIARRWPDGRRLHGD